MARLDRGLSAFVALTASLLLLLLSPKIFANDDAVFNNHLASGDSAAVAAALVDSEVKVSKTKIALPFGNKAAAHLNHLADKSLWAFPRIKRADPSDGEDEEPITITWDQAKADGALQIQRLSGIRIESTWLTENEMIDPDGAPENGLGNGWVIQDEHDIAIPSDLENVFTALDIPNGPENVYRIARQTRKFANCLWKDLESTNAYFSDWFNVQGRTIIAENSFSPASRLTYKDAQGKETPRPVWQRLPKVSRMSDVLWIQWAAVANAQGIPGKASDLKYIFRHEIITPNTQFIMEKAGNDPDAEEGEVFFKPWPGREFTMGEEQFQALMGTVHAKSIVTLLTTHPRELGTKSIEKVNIFATRDPEDSTSIYHMLWTLTG